MQTNQPLKHATHNNATLHLTSVATHESVSSMNTLESKLLGYWNDLTGEPVALVPHPDASLPLYLRERYRIFEVNFIGKELVLAVEKYSQESFSVGEYERHAAVLREKLKASVVFVIASLPSSARTPMIRRRIPFVVPKSQTFLPSIWIDLKDRQPLPPGIFRKKFTPAAQCLLLFHLQCKPLSGIPLQDIAQTIGYSPIMITKVKSELEAANLCEAVKKGNAVTLNFYYERKLLWEHALPYLSAPDRHHHWIQWDQPGAPALLAGISALSIKTMISSDRIRTFALHNRRYLQLLEAETFQESRVPEEASVQIECWTYDPFLLSDGSGCVDELSLCLSLSDSLDDRVQQQVEKLLQEFPW